MSRPSSDRRTFLAALPLLPSLLLRERSGSAGDRVDAHLRLAGKDRGVAARAGTERGRASVAQPDRQLPVPDWMRVDREARRVELEVVAGQTEENNRWNLNGLINGESDVVVPEGFEIRLTFRNDDPAMAHSLGVAEMKKPWPAVFEDPSPVFEGAITTNPTSATDATKPGTSEVLTFTASRAGEFALVCLVPGHALTGMWTWFVVSAEGAAGVREHG